MFSVLPNIKALFFLKQIVFQLGNHNVKPVQYVGKRSNKKFRSVHAGKTSKEELQEGQIKQSTSSTARRENRSEIQKGKSYHASSVQANFQRDYI